MSIILTPNSDFIFCHKSKLIETRPLFFDAIMNNACYGLILNADHATVRNKAVQNWA